MDISPPELSSGVRECPAKQRPTDSTWKSSWQLSEEDSGEAAGNETPQYPGSEERHQKRITRTWVTHQGRRHTCTICARRAKVKGVTMGLVRTRMS
jgi:hypothetical protein